MNTRILAAMSLLLTFTFGFSRHGYAVEDTGGVLAGSRLDPPPTIDGTINDDEWKNASSGESLVTDDTNSACPEPFKFWIGYDKDYIYFAAKAFDSQPDTISATEERQNVSLDGNDRVMLFIDPVGQLRDFSVFAINPKGATNVSIGGGRAAKAEWLGQILGRARITSDGYEVEARIPWQIMRLPGAGPRTVRFNVQRYIQRFHHMYAWRYFQTDPEKMGAWTDVEIPKFYVDHTIKMLPYGYVGGGNVKPILNVGADLKTQLTDRIEANAAINPDFRNLERSILSLDFSYLERLADDTRPFFREGQGYFRTGFFTKMFASQRIDRFDLGEKVYGKINDQLQFGVLNVTEFQRKNAAVASVSYSPTKTSNVDFAFSSLRSKTRSNDAYFFNVGQQFGPVNAYFIQQGSFDAQQKNGYMMSTGFSTSDRGVSSWLDLTMMDQRFNPRLGFANDPDSRNVNFGQEFTKAYQRGKFQDSTVGWNAEHVTRWNGDSYHRSIQTYGNFGMRNQIGIGFAANMSKFEQFDDETLTLGVGYPYGNKYSGFSWNTTLGHIQEMPYVSHLINARYRPLPKLQLSMNGQWVAHGGNDMRQLIGTANWQFGEHDSVSSRAVMRNNKVNFYASYQRSGGLGTEFILIVGDPNAASFRSSVILKVVTPIDLKF